MQLNRATLVALCLMSLPAWASAQDRAELDTTVTLFRESGGPLEMTVITPSVDIAAAAGEHVEVRGGWEADIVSGASVAIVDAPGEVDAVTSATRLDDLRHTARFGMTFLGQRTDLTVAYQYGHESDYRSHSFDLNARAELAERNTVFSVGYARGFDRVCDLRQESLAAPERQRLPGSGGCFAGADDRIARDLELHTLRGAWSQIWSPILVTQLGASAQVLNGFQVNPYRSVWLGNAAAQEHHPDNRARYAADLGARIYLRRLDAILQPSVRVHRDTWDIRSITGKLSYVQLVGERGRFQVTGRYYQQTSATFFSDDYGLRPRGQYFTGDRELSAMRSYLASGGFEYQALGEDLEGERALQTLQLVARGGFLFSRFPDYRYGTAEVPNGRSFFVTLQVDMHF